MYLPASKEDLINLVVVKGEKCKCGKPLVEYDLNLPRCGIHKRVRTCEDESCLHEIVMGTYDSGGKLILSEKPEKISHECSW